MTPIRRVFRYEFVRVFRRKSFLFFSFGVPILMLVAYFGLTALNNNQPKSNVPVAAPTLSAKVNTLFADNTKLGIVDQSGLITDKVSVAPFTRYANAAEKTSCTACIAINHVRRS